MLIGPRKTRGGDSIPAPDPGARRLGSGGGGGGGGGGSGGGSFGGYSRSIDEGGGGLLEGREVG